MRLPAKLALIVLLAVGLGAGIAALSRGTSGDPAQGGEGPGVPLPERPYPVGSGPAFYLDLDDEQRYLAARKGLDDLTTAQARAMAGRRDDLALLCDDPRVRQLVLEDFERRAHLTHVEGAGFAEFFRLVRHPDFVPPLLELFQHPDSVTRRNAVNACMTQVDPRLTGALLDYYRQLEIDHPGQADNLRSTIIEAAMGCGGDRAALVFDMGLKDAIAPVRAVAAEAIRRAEFKDFTPRLVQALEKEDHGVTRVALAETLTAFGHPAGPPALLAGLEEKEEWTLMMAARAVARQGLSDALPRLRALYREHGGLAAHDLLVAAIILGDEVLLEEIDARPKDELPDAMTLFGLAARGHPADVKRLVAALRKSGDPAVHQAVGLGLERRGEAPAPELARTLIGEGVLREANRLGGWFHHLKAEDGAWLDEELSLASTTQRGQLLIQVISGLPDGEGHRRLLAWRERVPEAIEAPTTFRRLIDQALRLLDLSRLKRGTKDMAAPREG